jgi:hypothetical protein
MLKLKVSQWLISPIRTQVEKSGVRGSCLTNIIFLISLGPVESQFKFIASILGCQKSNEIRTDNKATTPFFIF